MSLAFITKKSILYAELMRLHKPMPIWMILWPVMWALWIAEKGYPAVLFVLIFACGVVVMRSAGCVINDIWDHEFDKHVPRTQIRPLPAGTVTVREAFFVAGLLLIIAAGFALTLNFFTWMLAAVGLVGAIIYPLMKRFTYYPQVILGIVFNWGIVMAFSATTNAVPNIAWLLLITTMFWTLAYDTIYAISDRDADIKLGLKSTAILLGDRDHVGIAIFQFLFLIGLILLGRQLSFNIYYYLGLLVVLGLFIYQIWLIRDRSSVGCMAAFNHNAWVGIMVFVSILMGML